MPYQFVVPEIYVNSYNGNLFNLEHPVYVLC